MIEESVLLESRTLRSSVLDRTDVLDRVKVLSLLPDGVHVTTAMVAAYFGATIAVVTCTITVRSWRRAGTEFCPGEN
ncbi:MULTISPECIES: hypothetical protein [Streptomyces]|uniref:hypothetical protein n=1 Tax=Streptomyces TaxID=1883 RepID=UPI001FCACE03|nr:hypothetical protein [Streptomyces prasinus]